ncbi:MAG: 4-alpha-glucanotransferase [Steroidobacteraceae bacterium]
MRLPVFDRRRAGVLLPLSALEAPLGRGGRAFVDWLASAGFAVWQMLPVGPAGADGSPFWTRADCAGDPALLDPAELPDPAAPREAAFLEASAPWLADYALFEALTRAHAGAPFWSWPQGLRDREPQALAAARTRLAAEVALVEREQHGFYVQWHRLRDHAHSRGVRLFGDMPFYVAPSSVETWAHRELFALGASGEPAVVSGVPPDYFTQLGQLWGNPVYDWDAARRSGFEWWRARVRGQLARFDLLRLDHFRALVAYWAVPAGAPDARGGAWHDTPGEELLRRLREELGDLPLVAEDLGLITPDVVALRKTLGLPGMRVLQFAFDGDPRNPHLPYMHEHDNVAYTGTHDNDTTRGWYERLDAGTRERVDLYLRAGAEAMPETLLRAALGSVAGLAVIPAQDLLGLGSEARLNTPGTAAGNWSWKLPPGALTAELARRYARLNDCFGRA